MQVIAMDGTVKLSKESPVNSSEDSRVEVMPVTIPAELNGIYMVRLELKSKGVLVSGNDYIRGAGPDAAGGIGDLKAITLLPEVKLTAETSAAKEGSHWVITTKLINTTKIAAFNVRLKITGAKSGKRILPAMYTDNYFTLLPGDQRTIEIKVEDADTHGEKPIVVIEGYNVR
jgi:hypothetical protein